jgi:AraC-like DNA-binding protein
MPKYEEILPNARLARYVECYWYREDPDGTPNHSVMPDGCVDILFSARNREPVDLSLVGLMTMQHCFDVPAGQFFFGLRFRPGLSSAFIPEVASLQDKTESLDNVLGATGKQIFEQLANAGSPTEMTRIMDRFLRPLEPPDAAQKALEHLAAREISIDSLSSETGISVRQLRRVCLERVGVSPKYLSRILRFRRAIDRVSSIAKHSAQPNWAQLATACGYFDQAHFIRDFEEFTGSTPGRYLQSLRNRAL